MSVPKKGTNGPKRGTARTRLEDALAFQLKAAGLPIPEREWRFHPTRKWRFDFAWPGDMLAAEVEGGIFVQGRHSRGAGILGDLAKYNEATVMGWRVVRVAGQHIKSGEALGWIEAALREEAA